MNLPIVKRLCSISRASCVALALSLFSPGLMYAASINQIFVLHSYSQEYLWTRGQHEGFIRALAEDAQPSVAVSTEYPDTKRRDYDEAYASELARHLRMKYKGYKPAAIYVTDDNALIFDDRVLHQYDIHLPESLRAQAVLFNPRLGRYEQHRSLILGSLIGLAVLLFLVATGSVVMMSRKNRELGLARNSAESANTLFNQLAEQNRTVHWEINAEGLYTYVSPVSYAVLGYRPEELVDKKRFYDLLTEEERDTSKRAAFEFFAQKEPFHSLENTARTKDGRLIWILTNGLPVLDDHGTFLGYRGSHSDISERKKAAEALESSLSLLSASLESTADGILIVDRKGKIARWNQKFADMWKLPEEVLSSRDDEKAINYILAQLADPGQFAAKVRKLYEQPEESSFDQIEFLDGRIFERYSQPQRIENDIVGRVWSFRDITERKQAEETKRENEERYRTLVESASDIVFRTDSSGNFTFINPAALRISGYEEKEIIGSHYPSLIRPDMRDEAIKFFGRQFVKGIPNTYSEYPVIMKDGREIWLGQNTQLIFQDGKVVAFQAVARDITDRRRIEAALQESEERYRQIANCVPDLIWTVDLSGRFTYVNSAVERTHGWTVEEFLKLTFRDIATHQQATKEMAVVREEIAKAKAPQYDRNNIFTFETNDLRKDGSTFRSEVSAAFLWSDDSKPIGIIGTTRDITERRRAEEENRALTERLQRAEKMEALGQLAGGVAHDLNNVLGILSGYSELLLLEIPEGSRSRGHVEKILQSTEKGAAIIQDLLTLARRGVTASDVIDLNRVVSDFLKTPVFEKMKDYHPRVTFRTECDKNLLNIKGSPVHLEKTLMNLVSNASESISGIGEVTIRTESRYLDKPLRGYDEVKEGNYAVLTVSDTGMGIPAENREKIFEPFYTKKAMGRSGTGLGLAIVWGTVKDHNGYLDLQTEVGEGTTFTLYFPVTREELIAPQQKKPMERYMGKGESVLIVDDIADQRDIAAGLITRLGYQVHVVSSGEEAVEYLKGNKADILVLDMIMTPGIDGLETYQRVLEINPKQKAIIVSGFSETARVKEAQRLGAGAYVKKPYIMEKIGVAIRDELNR